MIEVIFVVVVVLGRKGAGREGREEEEEQEEVDGEGEHDEGRGEGGRGWRVTGDASTFRIFSKIFFGWHRRQNQPAAAAAAHTRPFLAQADTPWTVTDDGQMSVIDSMIESESTLSYEYGCPG